MSEVIKFEAAVSQVRTLADGGIRLQLDLPEDAIPQMAMLAEAQRQGIYLTFTAKASPQIRERDVDDRPGPGNGKVRKGK